jgi:hypothetical protein
VSADRTPAEDLPSGAVAIAPAEADGPASPPEAAQEPPRCGRWKLKPFELPRPVLLTSDGPLSLHDFLLHPDPTVLESFRALDPEQLQALVLARLAGAPPEMRLSLFGTPGYTIRDVVQHVRDGTPLGVRVIEAERKLVGLLLTEALRPPDAPPDR